MKFSISSIIVLHFVCILTFVVSNPVDDDEFMIENDYSPIVEVSQGLVRGIVANSTRGRQFYSFRGIPYGEPPIGDLRFKAPIEVKSWSETFNATDNAVPCAQASGVVVIGSEDCLTINVYTPSLPEEAENELLPVLVFIYGGGFVTGTTSSNLYGPERYMDKDVVLVLMNYRVGPFGFFSTGDEAASGNWGLLDQVLALKWVKTNIAAFGGDSERVTINGQSAGSASVMYQVISPAAQGLFRGAIAESGSSISLWALQRKPLQSALRLGELLECQTNDTTQILVDCVRSADTDTLVKAAIKMQTYNYLVLPFLPVVENNKTGQFLTEYPIKLLENGQFNKVPVISGSNKEDGDLSYGMVQFAYNDIDETFFNYTLPALLYAYFKYDGNLIDVSYGIKEEYYDKIDVSNHSQVARASIDFNTDAVFTAINDQTTNLLAKGGVPVYTYVFGYPGSASKHNYSGEIEVSHGDELSYLFDTGVALNDEDQVISDTLIDMWINFTYSLNPTPSGSWQPKTDENNCYLIIREGFEIQDGYRTEQMEFWNTQVPEIMGLIEPSQSTSTSQQSTSTSQQSTSTLKTTTKAQSTTTTSPSSGNVIHVSHFLIIISISIFLCVAL